MDLKTVVTTLSKVTGNFSDIFQLIYTALKKIKNSLCHTGTEIHVSAYKHICIEESDKNNED